MSTPTGPAGLPAGLRERVLERSRDLRPPGRATPEPEPISEVEAFRRTAASLAELLASLAPDQWRRPALRGLDVQQLIGHLIAVEQDVQAALTGDTSVADADHVASSEASAARQSGQPTQVTRTSWVAAVSRTAELAESADQDAEVAVHTLHLPVRMLCVVRAFELWTHENDIRRALGLPQTRPDASTLTLMTRLAASLLPLAASGNGLVDPVALRLVLTGPGGGTWQVSLGRADSGLAAGPTADSVPAAVAVGIVADAAAFCALVANRVAPAELDSYVTGDPERVRAILHAATTLALD